MPTLLNDNPDFFELKTDDGQVQKVAKAGLSPDLQSFIASQPRAQEQLATNDAGEPLALASQAVSRQNQQVAPPEDLAASVPPPAQAVPPSDPALLQAIHADPDTANASQPRPGEATGPASSRSPQDSMGLPANPFGAGLGMAKKAIDEGARIGIQKAAETKSYADEVAKNAQQFQDEQIVREADKQKQLQQAEATRQQAADSIKDFKFQDYWADKSTGAKITAAIAVGLGAYSASVNGGENQAAKIIDSAVQRDVQLQKAKFEQLKDSAGLADSAYGKLYQRLGDKDLAAKQLYITGLEASKAKMEASMAKYGSADAKNGAAKSIAELQMNIDRGVADYSLKAAELGAKQRQAIDAKRETWVPSANQFAPTKEAAQEINKEYAAINQSKSLVGHLQKISSISGGSVNPSIKAEADTVGVMLQGALKDELFKGRLNDREIDMLKKIAVNPTDIFTLDSTNRARLNAITKSLDLKGDAMLRTYGLTPSRGITTFKPSGGSQ